MTVTASSTSLFTSGAIQFSSLRSSFKEVSSGSVSASELKRNTNTSSSNPIVPDSTENASVSTSNNLKLSQFRNTIKYYDLTQSGTDTNLDLFAQSWNSNLYKNIVKRMIVNGTCGSTSTGTAALYVNASVCNLTLIVNGSVLGAGGGGAGANSNGGNGGDAMNLISSGTSIRVLTQGGAQVYGGGGGGCGGQQGANGTASYCYYVTSRTITCSSTCECCPGCNSNETGGGCNCFSNCYQRRRTRCNYNQTCYLNNYYYTGTPAGGSGGSGGNGAGYGQSRTNGVGGSGGGGVQSCSPNNTASNGSAGSAGTAGGNGGDWASDGGSISPYSGGSAGRAISGSNYSIDPNSVSSAFRGAR
jgi:hypothetical protein